MNTPFLGTGLLSAGFVRSACLGLTGVLTLALTACATEPSSTAPAAALTPQATLPSEWIKGIDVSEARGAEAAGVTFKDRAGAVKPALQIVKDHQYNWVRVRLMVDPDGTYGLLQDLPYVKAVMKDAKGRGLKVLLDLHYSHWWADPGNQWTPARWAGQDVNALSNSVYAYTKDVISQLRAQGTAPDMVQIGNEINGGLLWEAGRIGNMANFVKLSNAGATAVRDASGGNASMPPIMVHIAKTGDAAQTVAWYRTFVAAGGWVDAIGLSYYPMWHGDFANLSSTVSALRSNFSWAKVYLAETAFYWDTNQVGYSGLPYPQTQQGQSDYLKALTPAVRNAGGSGIFYWGAFWSQSARWLTAPGWTDDDASRRSLFDDQGRATLAVDGLN
ncbi:glycosyl hydrolase 53 family protein [Deinococcus sp. QL22]|uniref:glycosyl hydrolase 53 family protein n=1 Tax=Deinococcus sp. QL22 TaxID=2939437 RepID=UPI002017F835|nr:glycosyl hydrolase 53 family protein [Deinococcus sp. QL22]UQN09412.1 arabinogalactan endo-1,4-beta-galactosidase [Deinococcus sp. QL22]